ncbi:MAG TPA: glycosyltransferase family 39 protein [Tepidisphaeraceae bacterium]|jgi:4-amino-4-deoxy-L-arabinose transferase-like glycosyltransferase
MLEQDHSRKLSSAAVWWPVIAAALVIAALSAAVMVVRLVQVYPHDPWESIIASDGYRVSAGLPVYTDIQTDHATHMYGPLMIYVVGLVYKLTGVHFMVGRLVALAASIWIVSALTAIYFRRLPWMFAVAGAAMLLSLNLRIHAFFALCKTDMVALGFALLALILIFQAIEKGRWGCYPLALVSFCLGYLTKQPAAMFTLVPLLAMLLGWWGGRRWSVATWVAAAAAPGTIVILIGAISVLNPYIHYYTFVTVSRWPMRFNVLAVSPLRLLSFSILVPVGLALMLLVGPALSLSDARWRWLIAACAGALPGSFLAYAKLGGGLNSFLPALVPLTVLAVVAIAAAWASARASLPISTAQAHAFAWVMALVMIISALNTETDSTYLLFAHGHGDRHYPRVIEHVRALKGRVVCPDDPTIPIRALGQVGRSSWAENDAVVSVWMPEHLQLDIMRADYVVVVNSTDRKYLKPDLLESWGFVPAGWNGEDLGIYALWRKEPTAPTASPAGGGL